MERFIWFVIRKYKKYISPMFEYMGIKCKYYPTCSEYMRASYIKIWFFSRDISRNQKDFKM